MNFSAEKNKGLEGMMVVVWLPQIFILLDWIEYV